MSTQPRQPGASTKPGGLAGYLEAMYASGTPLLGHLVLYSVFEGEVTPGQLHLWFTQLGLDAAFLPARSARSTPSKRSPARPGSGTATRSTTEPGRPGGGIGKTARAARPRS